MTNNSTPCTINLAATLSLLSPSSVCVRAATDPADQDPDPDLLTTRIQNSRSGSVKRIFFAKFSAEIWALKIYS